MANEYLTVFPRAVSLIARFRLRDSDLQARIDGTTGADEASNTESPSSRSGVAR